MGAIYRKAVSVVVWLGASDPDGDQLFRFLDRAQEDRLSQPLNEAQDDQKMLDNLKRLWDSWPPAIKPEVKQSLKALLELSYFRRVWIIQEVAQSRSASIRRGKHSVPAEIFARLPDLLEVETVHHCQQVLNIMPGLRNSSASQSTDFTQEGIWIHRKLRSLLQDFKGSESTESRDKIYALLGLSMEHKDDMLALDYNKAEHEIVRDTIVTLLPSLSVEQLPWWRLAEFWENLDSLENVLLIWASRRGYVDVVKQLLEKMETETDMSYEDQQLQKALYDAAKYGKGEVVALLLKTEKVNINFRGEEESSPLDVALRELSPELLMKLLGTEGVLVDLADQEGQTPLILAARSGRDDVVRLLLAKNVDVNAADQNGRTPLSYAAKKGSLDVVESLLGASEIDIDHRDQAGRTPLSYAAERVDPQIVERFIKTKAVDVNSKDQSGRTPLSWIDQTCWSSAETYELLLDAGGEI